MFFLIYIIFRKLNMLFKSIFRLLRSIVILLILYFTSTLGLTYMVFPLTPLLILRRKLYFEICSYLLGRWLVMVVVSLKKLLNISDKLFRIKLKILINFLKFFTDKILRIKIYMHESKATQNRSFTKSSIIILNHRTRLDWLFYFSVLNKMNGLNRIKIILKDGFLKNLTGPSWGMQHGMFIFIKRQWNRDQFILKKFIDFYKSIEQNVLVRLETKHKLKLNNIEVFFN